METPHYTESEIRQKIAEYKSNKHQRTNPFVGWKAIVVYILLLLLCVDFLLKLWRLPFGIGMGVVILVVLFAWGLPAIWKMIRQNTTLRKQEAKDAEEIKKLYQMLEKSIQK